MPRIALLPSLASLRLVAAVAVLSAPGAHAQACGDCDGNGVLDALDALLVAQIFSGLPAAGTSGCDVDAVPGVQLCDVLVVSELAFGLGGVCPVTTQPCAAAPAVTVSGQAVAVDRVMVSLAGGTVTACRGTVTYDPAELDLLGMSQPVSSAFLIPATPDEFFVLNFSGGPAGLDLVFDFAQLAPGCAQVTIDILEILDQSCCEHPPGQVIVTLDCDCGDCDGNGILGDIVDALAAAQLAVRLATGLVLPTPTELATCDVSGDAQITVLDALLIAQHAALLPVQFMCP